MKELQRNTESGADIIMKQTSQSTRREPVYALGEDAEEPNLGFKHRTTVLPTAIT